MYYESSLTPLLTQDAERPAGTPTRSVGMRCKCREIFQSLSGFFPPQRYSDAQDIEG